MVTQNKTLPELVKEIRNMKGLTQQDLANLVAVNSITISRWERGAQTPRQAELVRLYKLARRFGLQGVLSYLTEHINPEYRLGDSELADSSDIT